MCEACGVCSWLTHFLLHAAESYCRHCSRLSLRSDAVIRKLFATDKKNCQSLSQQWSWFTWTLALRKKLIWSCSVLFNLDINLCLSSFDKVNSTVIVVKGNLLLGELNAFWWNFEEQAKISNRIVVEVYKVWILT